MTGTSDTGNTFSIERAGGVTDADLHHRGRGRLPEHRFLERRLSRSHRARKGDRCFEGRASGPALRRSLPGRGPGRRFRPLASVPMYEAMRRRPTGAPRTAAEGRTASRWSSCWSASSLMLVITFAALGLLEIAQRSEPEIRETNERIQEAQVGMERMIRELRQSYSVVSAHADQPDRQHLPARLELRRRLRHREHVPAGSSTRAPRGTAPGSRARSTARRRGRPCRSPPT